jgi:pyruvate,water dikinase
MGARVLSGVPASPGTCRGVARIVRSAADLARIRPGDVLVTGSTTPAIGAVLPLLAGIVTDRGGLLSHAAIVAREFGIPAVVGTGDATTRIPDGALVAVDGAAGQAVLLGSDSDPNRSR